MVETIIFVVGITVGAYARPYIAGLYNYAVRKILEIRGLDW